MKALRTCVCGLLALFLFASPTRATNTLISSGACPTTGISFVDFGSLCYRVDNNRFFIWAGNTNQWVQLLTATSTIAWSGASMTLTGLTANAFLYSGTGGLLTTTAAPTNGQLLIGSTGVAPVLASLTGTANRVTVTGGAGSITLSGPQDLGTASSPTFAGVTLTGGTVTVSTPLITGSQTWNAGAVTFIGDDMNFTDTASAADSLVWRRQVGASTVASVDKSGNFIAGNAGNTGSYRFTSATRFNSLADGVVQVVNNATTGFGRFVFGPNNTVGASIKLSASDGLQIRTGSDTADASISASTGTFSGAITATAGTFSGQLLSSSATLPLGYAAGAGGTVTQLTDKGTGVTLNTVTGQITMNAAALAANTTVSFVLTNSAILAPDVLILNHVSAGTAGAYTLNSQATGGSTTINVRNVTGGSLSEAIVIGFAVIKGRIS